MMPLRRPRRVVAETREVPTSRSLPTTPTTVNFLQLPLVHSHLEEGREGVLYRIEVRKDELTGRTLRGRFPIPASKPGSH